jgi:hypothetical protein
MATSNVDGEIKGGAKNKPISHASVGERSAPLSETSGALTEEVAKNAIPGKTEVAVENSVTKKQKGGRPYNRLKVNARQVKVGEKMRRLGLQGVLATTHVMVAKKATSEKVRCVLGNAMMEVASRKGTLMKARRRNKVTRKRLGTLVKVRLRQCIVIDFVAR